MRFIPILLFSFSAFASPFHGPISSAIGGTGRGGIESSEGTFLNPAALTLIEGREIALYYHDGQPQAGEHSTAYGLGFADNTKNLLFAGSLHYIRGRDLGLAGAAASSDFLHVALAKNFTHYLSFGASAYRLAFEGENDVGNTQWNFSLGALVMFTPDIGLGYVLDNPAHPSGKAPVGLRQELQQGIGLFVSAMETVRFRVDITRNETDNPNKRFVYMLGSESQMNDWMIFRLGFRDDDQQTQSFITAGLGFNGPRLKLDYAFEKALRGASGALHSVDMRIPF